MIRPDLVVLQGTCSSGGSALLGSEVLGSSCSVGDGCCPGVSVSRGSGSVETDFGGSTVIGSFVWKRCLRFLLYTWPSSVRTC